MKKKTVLLLLCMALVLTLTACAADKGGSENAATAERETQEVQETISTEEPTETPTVTPVVNDLSAEVPDKEVTEEAIEAANSLHELGLLEESGTNADGTANFALERPLTREQAAVMLVKLLDKEEEALAGNWDLPFTDVAKDSDIYPYIAYAHANGWISGETDSVYSGTTPLTAEQYMTCVLYALGYEKGKDINEDITPLELANAIDLNSGEYTVRTKSFSRGDMAVVTLKAAEILDVLETAPSYGIPADIRWIPTPISDEDVDNNILYSFLFGNLDTITTGLSSAVKDTMAERIEKINLEYPELVSAVSEQTDPTAGKFTESERQAILANAPYYGVPSDIRWIAVQISDEDIDNNILYSFLFGNYGLNFTNIKSDVQNSMQDRIKNLSHTYPELVGVFCNTVVDCDRKFDGLSINFPIASLTNAELYEQQIAALEAAQNIKATLHEQGKIKDGMTELEIAKVYSNYLKNLGISIGGGEAAARQGKSVEYDSAYACLVNKKADGVGRIGALNLLLHLEGISSKGTKDNLQGCATLDGKAYYFDNDWNIYSNSASTGSNVQGSGSGSTQSYGSWQADSIKGKFSESERQAILATAPYWGVSSNIQWIESPKTIQDVDNNILYSFLFGNYSLDFTNIWNVPVINSSNWKIRRDVIRDRVKRLSQTYPELVGVFCNTEIEGQENFNGVSVYYPESTLTNEQIYANHNAVLDVAKNIKSKLHSNGKIEAGMSQLDIAEVYWDHLQKYQGDGASGIKTVEEDSPYACLVAKKAACVGKAGAFNLLMHLEGISSQGVAGRIKSVDSGHVLSRVTLDGKTYYCDWGNRRPLQRNIDSWFDFNVQYRYNFDYS